MHYLMLRIKQNNCERGFMQKPWCYLSLISFISYIESFKEYCYITFKIYQKLQIIITCTTTTVLYAHIIAIVFKWPPCFHPWLLPFMSTSSQNDIPNKVDLVILALRRFYGFLSPIQWKPESLPKPYMICYHFEFIPFHLSCRWASHLALLLFLVHKGNYNLKNLTHTVSTVWILSLSDTRMSLSSFPSISSDITSSEICPGHRWWHTEGDQAPSFEGGVEPLISFQPIEYGKGYGLSLCYCYIKWQR